MCFIWLPHFEQICHSSISILLNTISTLSLSSRLPCTVTMSPAFWNSCQVCPNLAQDLNSSLELVCAGTTHFHNRLLRAQSGKGLAPFSIPSLHPSFPWEETRGLAVPDLLGNRDEGTIPRKKKEKDIFSTSWILLPLISVGLIFGKAK